MPTAKKKTTATVDEITEFWTGIMRDDEADLKDRLKVSELLLKALLGAADEEITKTVSPLDGMSLEEKLEIIERIRKGN